MAEHPEWKAIVDRAPVAIIADAGATPQPGPQKESTAVVSEPPVPSLADAFELWRAQHSAGAPSTVPARPWGDARTRKWIWWVLLAAIGLAAIVLLFVAPPNTQGIDSAILGLVVAGAGLRAARGARVAQLEQQVGVGTKPAEPGPTSATPDPDQKA